MATQPPTEVKPALLFMPDISGFTKFVSETEILHGQHIVQELLEILIDSNELGMQVNEVEGDAILFFRPGKKPSLDEITRQVEKMYFNFHQHLKLYDHQRICSCGACESAIKLKLKMIAHYGEVAEFFLKQQKRLFGKEVIVIHRLLKNDVDHDEYVLLTDPLVQGQPLEKCPSWFSMNEMTGVYDAGEIKYAYAVLNDLKEKVPAPPIPEYHLSEKCTVAFSEEENIKAPMPVVFDAMFDLKKRLSWADGVKDIEILNHDKINRIGAEHRCIVKPKNNPTIVTEYARVEPDRIVFIEMDKKGMGGCRTTLEKKGSDLTHAKLEVLVKNNPFVRSMFNLLMKKKYRQSYRKSLENLGELLGEKRENQELRPEPSKSQVI
jgi:hypothetical protein